MWSRLAEVGRTELPATCFGSTDSMLLVWRAAVCHGSGPHLLGLVGFRVTLRNVSKLLFGPVEEATARSIDGPVTRKDQASRLGAPRPPVQGLDAMLNPQLRASLALQRFAAKSFSPNVFLPNALATPDSRIHPSVDVLQVVLLVLLPLYLESSSVDVCSLFELELPPQGVCEVVVGQRRIL